MKLNKDIINQLNNRFSSQEDFTSQFEAYLSGDMKNKVTARFFDTEFTYISDIWDAIKDDSSIKLFTSELEDKDIEDTNIPDRETLDSRALKLFSISSNAYSEFRRTFAVGDVTKDSSILKANLPTNLSKLLLRENERLISADQLYFGSQGEILGRESSPHITIGIGLDVNSFDNVSNLDKIVPVRASIESFEIFEKKDHDVVVLKVNSVGLTEVNKILRERNLIETKYDYNPHITLAYVKKGSFNHNGVKSRLLSREFYVDSVQISKRKVITDKTL